VVLYLYEAEMVAVLVAKSVMQ